MISYGFCFRPELGREECSGFLSLWVADDRHRVRHIPTPYEIYYDEWDPVTGWIVLSGCTGQRLQQLNYYADCMKNDLRNLQATITDLERDGEACSARDVVQYLECGSNLRQVRSLRNANFSRK